MNVRCANCDKVQEDLGKRKTCEKCGTFPLPSYAYARESSFHPASCGCELKKAPPIVPRRTTITPLVDRLAGAK